VSLPSPAPSERYACPQCLSVFRAGFARCPLDGAALQSLVGDPLIGHLLADRYVIEELLGEGGMGRVYRARHMRMSRRFAVKVLFGDMAADAKARTRFSREAEAVSRLDHPNVLSVVDFGETEEGLLYLVMDYIEGRELHQLLAQEAPLSAQRVLALLRQLCRGLAHAHERNLVHRDFKTENVVVTKGGDEEIAHIVDFGIAAVGEMMEPEQRLTTEGMVLGTPAYMSPEQSTGEEVDERSDLFSLGVMLYEMLCGRLPFDGSAVAIAKAHLAAEVPPIAVRVPGLRADPRLEAVAMRLMAKDPGDRFQTARAIIAHLDAAFGRADSHPDGEEHDETVQIGMDDDRVPSAEQLVIHPLELTELTDSGQTRRIYDRRWIAIGAAVTLAAVAVVIALVMRGTGGRGRGRDESASVASVEPVAPVAAGALAGAEPAAVRDPPVEAPERIPPPAPEPAPIARPPSETPPVTPPPTPSAADDPAEANEPTPAPSKPRQRPKPRSTRKPPAAHAAAPAEPKPTEPKPTEPKPKPTEPKPAAEQPPPAAAAPPAEPVVSTQEFLRRYEQVGGQLDQLASKHGDAAVSPLRRRYMDIPLQDALRSEAVRRDADRNLKSIATRAARALKAR